MNETTDMKTMWCRICEAWVKFFKNGETWYCEHCHYAHGYGSELTVKDD